MNFLYAFIFSIIIVFVAKIQLSFERSLPKPYLNIVNPDLKQN